MSVPKVVELGPPRSGVHEVGGYRVTLGPARRRRSGRSRYIELRQAASRISTTRSTGCASSSSCGVLGGTAAGASRRPRRGRARDVADRRAHHARRREVARTRDPDVTLPKPRGERRGRGPRPTPSRRCSRSWTPRGTRARPPSTASVSSSPTPRTSCARRSPASSPTSSCSRPSSPARTARDGRLGTALVAADAPAGGRPAAARARRRRPRSRAASRWSWARCCARRRPRLAPTAADHELSVDVEPGARDRRRRARRPAPPRLNLIENAVIHTPPGTAVTRRGAPRGRHRGPRRWRTTAPASHPTCATASSSASSAAPATPEQRRRRQRPRPGDRAGGGRGPRRLGDAGEPGGRWGALRGQVAGEPRCRSLKKRSCFTADHVRSWQFAVGPRGRTSDPDRLRSAWAVISGALPAYRLAVGAR